MTAGPAGRARTREVAQLFLKLGCIAFGGPAAHIAMMRAEAVTRRAWLSDEEFLDLVGGASLIPGPSSTELAIFLGYSRAGPTGLILAGLLFIAPAFLLVLGLAWLYVRSGSVPAVGWLLYGVKPVVVAIILHAIYQLARPALWRVLPASLALASAVLYLRGLNPLPILAGAGGIGLAAGLGSRRQPRGASTRPGLTLFPWLPPALSLPLAATRPPVSLGLLFLTFLKIGAVVFGSGYVLLAFVQDDFVRRLGWLTSRQVIDAVAVGQVTPGPVFTTATFIGYVVAGVPGAALSTVAIFLPSFLYAALAFPLIPRLRGSATFRGFLDGVNAAALGLMGGVALTLARAGVVDPFTVALAVASGAVLFRWQPNVAWLLLAGGAGGVVWKLAGA